MFYENVSKSLKVNYQTLEIKDFSYGFDYDNNNPNTNIAKLCVNFNTDDFSLSRSYGDTDFNCYIANDTESRVYPSIDNLTIVDMKYFLSNQTTLSAPMKQLMAVTSDYKVYTTVLDDGSTSYLSVMDLPENCEYRMIDYCFQSTNYMIISTRVTDEHTNYVYAGHGEVPKEIGGDFFIYDICNHNNKMFVVLDEDYRCKILFGDDLNPLNIQKNVSSMESIRIPASKGKILKLISLGDYLYVFCEFGIYRMISYTSQKRHYLEEVYNGNAKIIENTIVVGGENIIFSDELGVYLFNGNSVDKIDLKFYQLFKGTRKYMSVACFNDNKYFLATKLNYRDGIVEYFDSFRNNALIVYDVLTKKVELCCDLSIRKMITYTDAYKSRVAILSGHQGTATLKTLSSDSGLYIGNISNKIWQSNDYDLNKPNAKKIIRYLHLKTSNEIKFTLIADGQEYEYSISGSTQLQKLTLNIKARVFSFKIESSTTLFSSIESIKFVVGVYE